MSDYREIETRRSERQGQSNLDERLTYTVNEGIRLSGLSRMTFYDRVKDGSIPSIRIGGRILLPKAAFHRLLGADL